LLLAVPVRARWMQECILFMIILIEVTSIIQILPGPTLHFNSNQALTTTFCLADLIGRSEQTSQQSPELVVHTVYPPRNNDV
jgi:hypothetical protein